MLADAAEDSFCLLIVVQQCSLIAAAAVLTHIIFPIECALQDLKYCSNRECVATWVLRVRGDLQHRMPQNHNTSHNLTRESTASDDYRN